MICVEPHPESAALLRQNVARYGDRVTVIEAAAWTEHATLQLTPATDDSRNTGGVSVMRVADGIPVQGVPLSEILAMASPRVRLLKLDCEGAEHVILDESILDCVQELCGEVHRISPDAFVPRPLEAGRLNLALENNGPNTALVWARRHIR